YSGHVSRRLSRCSVTERRHRRKLSAPVGRRSVRPTRASPPEPPWVVDSPPSRFMARQAERGSYQRRARGWDQDCYINEIESFHSSSRLVDGAGGLTGEPPATRMGC